MRYYAKEENKVNIFNLSLQFQILILNINIYESMRQEFLSGNYYYL